MPQILAWTWPEIRDRAQVGAFFGAMAGIVALLLTLGFGLVLQRTGRAVALGEVLRLHAWLILLYTSMGLLIGALWPRRASGLGRWSLWLLASLPISVTILAMARGEPAAWDQRSWMHLAIMIPAFAWVMGDGPKRPRQNREEQGP